MTEKQIENNILCFLDEIGIFARKIQSVGIWDPTRKIYRKSKGAFRANGMPDILGILPDGRFLGIEVKSRLGRATPEQLHVITQINQAGGLAFISRSVEQTFASMRHALTDSDRHLPILNKWVQLETNLSVDIKKRGLLHGSKTYRKSLAN